MTMNEILKQFKRMNNGSFDKYTQELINDLKLRIKILTEDIQNSKLKCDKLYESINNSDNNEQIKYDIESEELLLLNKIQEQQELFNILSNLMNKSLT